jgi:hypothetical protein
LAFAVSHSFTDPFDTADVELSAEIVDPAGAATRVRLFYFEDFLFDTADTDAKLVPHGHPEFRMRYLPLTVGAHQITVTGSIGGVAVALPPVTVKVGAAAPDWRGFIRRCAEDDRLLVYGGTDKEFFGIGVNVRSPYDNRYRSSFPYTKWRHMNLAMYRSLFETYAKAGINVVEVWMSPWWLALEWIHDAPGNHGVGYMNPWRAWKLDLLFEWAAEFDIRIVLLLNNHGKFSTWCDADWPRSPYNTARGGRLQSPEQYFSDAWAKGTFKRFLDYAVARWGYSPNLLCWKLFSEIDLTGTQAGWYHSPSVLAWHREMGAYVKSIDPNRHLVTTHWSDNYNKVNEPLARVPELDMLTLDAYYHGSGANQLYNIVHATGAFSTRLKKPCVITEFGGSPWGDTMAHLLNQHHLGLWSGYFSGLASVPCFWWFPMLEEKQMYQAYSGLSAFVAGEERRGAKPSRRALGDGLTLCELRMDDHLLLWVFDGGHYFGGRLNPVVQERVNISLVLDELPVGDYSAEFWDCRSTAPVGTVDFEVLPSAEEEPTGELTLPAFKRDLAIKIRPGE